MEWCRQTANKFDTLPKRVYNESCSSPRGGIGIRGRLRACVRKDVEVQVLSGALDDKALARAHEWFMARASC